MPAKSTTIPKFALEPIPVDVNLASWFAGGNAGALKSLVHNETFRKAEVLLKEQARPTRGVLREPETNAMNQAWLAGYCDAFADLRKLTHAPTKTSTYDANEWQHIT